MTTQGKRNQLISDLSRRTRIELRNGGDWKMIALELLDGISYLGRMYDSLIDGKISVEKKFWREIEIRTNQVF